MSKRRRLLLGITLAFVAVVVIVWSLLAPRDRMEVKLVFLGYTSAGTLSFVQATNTISIECGVLMVTNAGSVPVRIFPNIRSDVRSDTSGYAPPFVSTRPLRPGDAALFQALVIHPQKPWWTEVLYCRYGLGMRVHDAVSDIPLARGMANAHLPAPKMNAAQSGWITNALP